MQHFCVLVEMKQELPWRKKKQVSCCNIQKMSNLLQASPPQCRSHTLLPRPAGGSRREGPQRWSSRSWAAWTNSWAELEPWNQPAAPHCSHWRTLGTPDSRYWGGGARPYIIHTHLSIHRCIDSRVCSNLSLSAITQLEVLYDRPHVHPGASWDSPKLCPISWAMVEARPMGLSWWSCKNTTAVLNCRSPPGWVKVGLDSSHLVDSAWVLRAHGELIC